MGKMHYSILIILSLPSYVYSMQWYEYNTELLEQDYTHIERDAYELLKRRPLQKNITYLAVPWLYYYERGLLKQVIRDLRKIYFKNAFTVCYGLFDGLAELFNDIGVQTVFTPRASIRKNSVGHVRIEPLPYVAINGVPPADYKDISCSFVGIVWSHPIRKNIPNIAKNIPDSVVKIRSKWIEKAGSQEYKNIMARSQFSLCPRGYADNSIRFWESLQAGAIPILISNYARLPGGFDWTTCVLRVPEEKINDIANILRSITVEQETSMRLACLQAYEHFSGDRYIRTIRSYFGED